MQTQTLERTDTDELAPLDWEKQDSLSSVATVGGFEYHVFKAREGGWLWACILDGKVLTGARPSHPYKSQGGARARAEQSYQDFEWFDYA